MNPNFAPNKESEPWIKWAYLEEECGELMAAMGKARRYGMESSNPLLPAEEQVRNGDWMLAEIQDVKHAITLMEELLIQEGFMAKEPK